MEVHESKARLILGRLPAWWSRVFFADDATLPKSGRAVRVCEVILVLAASVLSFASLDCPLQEPEETLYAEIPRQMLAEGRPLVPVRHGQDYYDKPPLLYWLVMGIYQLCGVHDWAARLIPCGAAFLCVLVTYAWGKHAVGPRAGFAGALMLCLSPRFAQMARMLTTNGLLTLLVVAGLATGHHALAGPTLKRRWWLLSALVCGLGLLTKGPVALVLVAGPILLYQALDRRSPRMALRPWLLYVTVAGLIALPWFVFLAIRDPDFVHYFVWTHHIRRFLDPIDHPQPVWYYVPLLMLGMLPWTLLLPGLAMHLARRMPPALPQRTGAVGFFLLAALWSLVFFSMSGCKRPSYILPVMPPLALALGCFVDAAFMLGHFRPIHWACAAAATFLLLFGAAEWLLPEYAQKYSLREQIAPHVDTVAAEVPVMCYPHGWDAVNFYLHRSDVRVFHAAQLGEMMSALQQHREILVVVKTDVSLPKFLDALPESLEFVACSQESTATVGWVRRR
jgi:4-amino-4-deoxy-L-arabinose transferase-like glycosyltransferase